MNGISFTSRSLLYLLLVILTNTIGKSQHGVWLTSGQNLSNTRYNKSETSITPENIAGLRVGWEFESEGEIWTTPAVDESAVYFPDSKGNLYKVDAATGKLMWSNHFSYYTGSLGDFARATPALSGNSLIIGTQLNFDDTSTLNGAHVLNINKHTGELQWMTKVDDFFAAVITQSAVVYGSNVYVGVSSMEEGAAASDDYVCCSFRGSVLSLNINTGEILWKTYMVPDSFPGGAVWGSTPVVDAKRGSLYVTTGNNYKVPERVLACVADGGTPEQVKACIDDVPGSEVNYFDAFVALDLKSGAVKWFRSVIPFDAWNVACLFEAANCPEEAGPDYDFGQGPALFTVRKNGVRRELLGAGQKSGIYWAVNPDNGDVVWQTEVGPGGITGGLQWGSAVDEFQVYTAVSNSSFVPHTMTQGPGRGRTVNGGFWASLDAFDGDLLWEVAGENPPASPPDDSIKNPIAQSMGPVSVANGIVFGGAMDSVGTMYAIDATTGEILWTFESGGSVLAGAAIVDGSIYWGSGYTNFDLGSTNNKLYAFRVQDDADASAASMSNRMDLMRDEIMQVAPNPFTEVTDIHFQLPIDEHVSLLIYDMFGKEIEVILNEEMKAGMYNMSWDSRESSNGQYVVKIVTPTFSNVKIISKIN